MDHINAMLEGDPDNVVLGEVSPNGRQALTDLVGLIGLDKTRFSNQITHMAIDRPSGDGPISDLHKNR